MLTPFPKVPVCADRQESGAHTTGDVSDAGSAHVPDWLILSGLWMLPLRCSQISGLSPSSTYIGGECKRNRLQINHNEHTLSTVGGIKGDLAQ